MAMAEAVAVVDDEDDLGKFLKENVGKDVTAGDLLTQARIEAGLDDDDLDRFPMLDRWVTKDGFRWIVLQEPPGGSMTDFIVLALFVGDQAERLGDYLKGEVRAYIAPRKMTGMCYRYVLSSEGTARAPMKARLFLEEIAHELLQMAVVFGAVEEDEDRTCGGCGETTSSDEVKFCGNCGAGLPEVKSDED